ncbi:MAG TPA: hypothetical protein DEB74_04790 [Lachnospiraceae bacterium]|nr:hypothetical protein [Lachnospiraceae bacterium]
MKKNQDLQKAPLESDQDFANFLQRVRKERDIHYEQLAEGLMSISQLSRIVKGKRPVHKNMRDRLLGRLGIASDLYENLLDVDDYRAWECQRNIMFAVEQGETENAERLIAEYDRQTGPNSKLKQQFCLVMRAEVLKQKNADMAEICACYEKAVKLTVPNVEQLCLETSLLSIQEINMILEYAYYAKGEGRDFPEACRRLMAFVENAVYDELSKVKIYPKIAYYYLREKFDGQSVQGVEQPSESLRICNRAIEMLRDTGRAFYLLELLEIKCGILEIVGKDSDELKESVELANLFRKLYAEYDIPAYMRDCVYLYRQRWIFYIGDVLRIRRNMYGLTQEELCEGICVTKTLRRAEKMMSDMHQDLLTAVMRRLGLSKEYQRARLVTNDREVLILRDELLVCRNNHNISRCREILNLMQKKLSLKIPENQQYIIELETSLDWMENKITKEELVLREEMALKITLNMDKLFLSDEIYLTEMEMTCIRKMIQGLDGKMKRVYIDLLRRFFDCYEKNYMLSDYIAMYEFVMIRMASELANMGDLNVSTDIYKKILKESLKCNRIWAIGNILYDLLWNEKERKAQYGKTLDKEKMTERLKQCILLSHFCKQSYEEKFYYDKLCEG